MNIDRDALTAAAAQLVAWLKSNIHPHAICIVDCNGAELLEGLATTNPYPDAPELFPGTSAELFALSIAHYEHDQKFCNTHGMTHSVEMRSPDCTFGDGESKS